MAIDFPNSPTNGQTFTVGSTTWTYDGTKWNKNALTITGPTGPAGGTGYVSTFTVTQTSYTLQKDNVNCLLVFTNALSITVNVPTDATAGWVVGERIDVLQKGGGQITFTGSSGVTLLTSGLAKTRELYSAITLVYLGADEWLLQGDMVVS
jgi:hypothetical protein